MTRRISSTEFFDNVLPLVAESTDANAARETISSLLDIQYSEFGFGSLFKRMGMLPPDDYCLNSSKTVEARQFVHECIDSMHGVTRNEKGHPIAMPEPRLKRVLFIPDAHHPYHDKRAWDLVLKIGQFFKPDVTCVLGDFLDLYTMSFHSKDPSRAITFETEIESGRTGLHDLKQLGASRNIYVEGNHEFRLKRYLEEKSPELHSLVTVPELMNLGSDWEWVPYRDHTTIGKINVTHDTGSAGATAHVKAGKDFEASVVIGHVHRMATSYWGNATGESHVSACFGWLGDLKAADYMHKIKATRDWHLGFGIGYMEADGTVHVQAVPIINYKAVVDGVLHES